MLHFNSSITNLPYQNLLTFNNFNFVHTSSQTLFNELVAFKQTLRTHPTKSLCTQQNRLNPFFRVQLRGKS